MQISQEAYARIGYPEVWAGSLPSPTGEPIPYRIREVKGLVEGEKKQKKAEVLDKRKLPLRW